MGETYSITLDVFEGPLDLLLHLVRRHELDILDIPIAFVTAKYLEYLDFMRALDLEIAGEYLVMAATLAYLKSRELLPTQALPDDSATTPDREPDPRSELIRRLLEYERFKSAAEGLDARPISGRDVFTRGAKVDLPPLDQELSPVTLFRLADAYHRVLERARFRKSHEVVLETVSVSQRMRTLTSILLAQHSFEFDDLFVRQEWHSERELRAMLVVTLMSLLELVKLGLARVHQATGSDTIVVECATDEQRAEQALVGYDQASSDQTSRDQTSSDQASSDQAELPSLAPDTTNDGDAHER